MVEKEEEEHEPDLNFLNKYFKEDDLVKKPETVKADTITEDVSISELPLNSYSYKGREDDEVGTQKVFDKTEKISDEDKKLISSAKKEFLKDLEDSDSLSLDTCANVGRSWGRGRR